MLRNGSRWSTRGTARLVYASNEKLNEEGARVHVIGKLVAIDRRSTRNGDPFVTAKLALLDDEVELTVWSNVLERTLGIWHEDVYAEVRGSVRMFNNSAGIAVSNAIAYIPTKNGDSRRGVNGSLNGSSNGVNGNGSHTTTYHGAIGRMNGEAQKNGETMNINTRHIIGRASGDAFRSSAMVKPRRLVRRFTRFCWRWASIRVMARC